MIGLKEARLRKGYKLSEVAEKLNISLKHLQALEDGDYYKLPGNTYLNGYVKVYAHFLGIKDYNEKLPDIEINQYFVTDKLSDDYSLSNNKIIIFCLTIFILIKVLSFFILKNNYLLFNEAVKYKILQYVADNE